MQAILFTAWAIIPFHPINVFIEFGMMLVVGLAGGCSYVNTYHMILDSDELEWHKKELASNCCTFSNDFGTLIAELLSILLSNTVYAR